MKEVEENFDQNINNYVCITSVDDDRTGEYLHIPKLLKLRGKVAIVACDEDYALIVPYSEIEERINFIKSGLNDKFVSDEMIDIINENLNKLHHSLLCITNIYDNSRSFWIGMVRYLLESDKAFFRNEGGRIKMYFGKSAFKRSFDEHSYVK